MRTAKIVLLMLLCALQAPASDKERFELFNDCQGMRLYVAVVGDAPASLEDSLQAAAESRLRAARLVAPPPKAAPPPAGFSVSVSVMKEERNRGFIWHLSVAYIKRLYDPASRVSYAAGTWERDDYGTFGHGGERIIREALAETLDRFIAAYLRVNESACGSPRSSVR